LHFQSTTEPIPSQAERASPKLDRTTFTTSRLLEFCSEKELVAQTGTPVKDWPVYLIKELVDNALDACEEADRAPEINIEVGNGEIVVTDNGPGLPGDTVKRILDFSVRISSREAYVSPTRGAQGNALKMVLAMPFALDGQEAKVEIEAHGIHHEIHFQVDHVRQHPVIRHEQGKSEVTVGTVVRVPWPNLAKDQFTEEDEAVEDEEEDEEDEGAEGPNSPGSIQNAGARFLQIATDYTWLNPHLSLTLDLFGERTSIKATDPAWRKWKPSDPTSPHWYAPAHLQRLVGAYVSHDADNGHERTVRELVAEFRGLSGSAKQKLVLDATGLARAPLSALIKGNGFDRPKIAHLLAAMQEQSSPVKPIQLGYIGKGHLERRFEEAGCNMESFEYRRIMDTGDDGIPWIIETAFGWCPAAKERRLVVGINWSATILNPFRELGEFGVSLDTILAQARADRDDPVIVFMHLAQPRVEFTDRGKSAVVMS
jgi:hypothetical protein